MKKPATVKRKTPRTSEQEFVREELSKATGVHFEVVPPNPAFPLAVDRLDWFMRCRNKEEIPQSPYLNSAWKEKRLGIWLESLAVGDTVDWIEIAYGDEKVSESLDIDYSRFDDPAFQDDFRQRFPIVLERIRKYERVVAEVSKKVKVNLQIRRAGSRGILVFTIAALVAVTKSASQAALGSAIRRNVSALKEAYGEIEIEKL